MDGTTLTEYVGTAARVCIPEGVSAIGPGAFRDRKQQIEEVILPESLREIQPRTFASCRGLRRVHMPAGLRSIGAGAFQDCEALAEIEVPAGVRRLRRNTFSGCRSLSYVKLSEGLQTLEDGAFRNCTALRGIRLPDSLREVGSTAAGAMMEGGVFAGSGIRELRLPPRVEVIGSGAFSGCTSLRSAFLPSGLRQIGSSAFSGCSRLRALRIPASVTSIGAGAFCGLRHPEEIVLPRILEKLRTNAGLGYAGEFGGCRVENGVMTACRADLSEVRIPAGVTTIRAGAFNRLADDMTLEPRRVAVTLPEALEVFERSRLGPGELIEFVFPPHYLQQTHQLPMPFTRDLIAGGHLEVSLDDAASLFLFQDRELSQYAAGLLSRSPVQAARAIFGILRRRRTSRALLRMAAFAEQHAAALPETVLEALYKLAQAAGSGAAALRLICLQEGAAGAERFCRECHSVKEADEAVRAAGLDPGSPCFSAVRLRSGGPASAHLVKCLLMPYLSREVRPQTKDPETSRQSIDSESKQLEQAVDLASLQGVMDDLFPPQELYANPRWFSAYCRFAGSTQIGIYDRRIRELYENDELLRRYACTALTLNDTREAQCRAAEYSCGGRFGTLLGYWSFIRGRSEPPLVDGAMRVHLDPDGVRRYTLSGRNLEIRLEDDLMLRIWDPETGTVSADPRRLGLRGRDAETLQADLDEMNSHLSAFAQAEREALRQLYITGGALTAAAWKRLYQQDPVRRRVAGGLIWTQGRGRSFRAGTDGLRGWNGSSVVLDDGARVRLAHLLEMDEREAEAWRAAPEEETVLDQTGERLRAGLVPADYYNGLSITAADKQRFEQFFGCESGSWQRLTVSDRCDAFVISCRPAAGEGAPSGEDAELRLGSFCLVGTERAANIALNLLDDMTIRERIRQDDPAAVSLIENAGCSPRQVGRYLDFAMQMSARHLTAALLERQVGRAAGADEFRLG